MFRKDRRLVDSRTKDKLELSKTLTRIQRETIELLLNSQLDGCLFFDPRVGGWYKRSMNPCSLNDLAKAIGKKVDKLFSKLSSMDIPIVKLVEDCRGRSVWMINPDLYWDYLGWELYYNRWLFELGSHRQASEVVNLSLYYGYYYHCQTCKPIKKIPKSHWVKMSKWWLLIDNDVGIELDNFLAYQPETGITDRLKVVNRE